MPQPLREYKDLNLSFLPHPATKDIQKLTGAEAVKRSIRNLVLTNFYERPFQPHLGSGVSARLFEPQTMLTAQQIKQDIEDVIKFNEPRAKYVEVTVTENTNSSSSFVWIAGAPDMSGFRVDIVFQIVNQIQPVTLSVFLQRTR